jgi:hypothetical protein
MSACMPPKGAFGLAASLLALAVARWGPSFSHT